MNWSVIAIAALAAGCAGNRVNPPPAPSSTPAANIESVNSWRADGRIAIQRGDEGWSARLRWKKSGDEFQIRLIAPLGRGTYEIAGNSAAVALVAPSGDRFTSTDAESLMREQLGWSIPLGGAQYWLRGLFAPGASATMINTDQTGRLKDMQQLGWRISFLRHVSVDGFELPAKLYLHHENLKVRIAISKWELN